jgi:hypothetical protein
MEIDFLSDILVVGKMQHWLREPCQSYQSFVIAQLVRETSQPALEINDRLQIPRQTWTYPKEVASF